MTKKERAALQHVKVCRDKADAIKFTLSLGAGMSATRKAFLRSVAEEIEANYDAISQQVKAAR